MVFPFNTKNYIKPEKFLAPLIGSLNRDTMFPQAFTRYNGNGFRGAEGDRVTWKTKSIATSKEYEFRTRTQEIAWDKIARTSVGIELDTHLTSLLPITDEENLLDLQSYMAEIGMPQAEAIAERAELKIKAALAAAPFKVTNLDAAEADNVLAWALEVKAGLDKQGTPRTQRRLLLGSNPFNWIMQSDQLLKYDTSQALTAFRNATVGRIAGFDIVDGGQMLGENEIYAVHPTALVVANLAPLVPSGASWGGRMASDGWSMRVVRDFDLRMGLDGSLLSTFLGVSSVNDEITLDANRQPVFGGVNGDEISMTGFNVRGARGTFVPTA